MKKSCGLLVCAWLAVAAAGQDLAGYEWGEPKALAWGFNLTQQAVIPDTVTNVIALAGGVYHSIALQADGRVAAWGWNKYGQTNVPPDLRDVVAIDAAGFYSLALRADGTVVTWGANYEERPIIMPPLTNIIAISAGFRHGLALTKDHTIINWGIPGFGPGPPPPLTNVVAISAGDSHDLALCADGTVVAWGAEMPAGLQVPTNLSRVVAIAAGHYHNLALQADGTVVAWGWNNFGQTDVPPGLTNVIAIDAGTYHSLALQADGRVVAWGWNKYGQTDVPSDLTNVALIAATEYHNLALRRPPEPAAETVQAAPSDAAARTTREPAALWRWGRNDGVSTGHAAQPTGGTTGEAAVEILAIAPAAGTALQSDRPGLEITWRSRAGHIYCVQVTDDLGQAAWQTIQAGIPATPPQNAFTLATDERLRFYRIGEKLAE